MDSFLKLRTISYFIEWGLPKLYSSLVKQLAVPALESAKELKAEEDVDVHERTKSLNKVSFDSAIFKSFSELVLGLPCWTSHFYHHLAQAL